jgi:hypothetical protein
VESTDRAPARSRATSPPSLCQPPFEILPSCDQQSFDIHVGEAPEPELRQPVPLLRFREERFDPHAPFPHGLLERRRSVIAAHPLQVAGVEGSIDEPAPLMRGTAVAHRTRCADRRGSVVLNPLSLIVNPSRREGLALWADIDVVLSVIDLARCGFSW